MNSRGNDFWEAFVATENGCDSKCDGCPVWWKHKQVCLHEDIANWEAWNVEEKQRRAKAYEELK